MPHNSGSCTCGKTHYSITGAPLTLYLCHCTKCQRRTGSAFGMTMHVPASNYRVTRGEVSSISSGETKAYFCSVCRSWVYTEIEKTKIVYIPAGTLHDTSELTPQANVWTRSAQPWVFIDPAMKNYEKQPERWSDLYPENHSELCK